MLQDKVRELIRLAKEQGYLTYEDLDEHLPEGVSDPEHLDLIISQLRGVEIEIIEASDVDRVKEVRKDDDEDDDKDEKDKEEKEEKEEKADAKLDILDDPVLDVTEQPSILPDSVGSALEPGAVSGSLGGGKDLDESLAAKADTGAHVVGASQVAVQRGRVELGEDVDLADAAVDAVALKRTHDRYDDE